jgi:hypothetical protein
MEIHKSNKIQRKGNKIQRKGKVFENNHNIGLVGNVFVGDINRASSPYTTLQFF